MSTLTKADLEAALIKLFKLIDEPQTPSDKQTIIYRPADLDALGLTQQDLVDLTQRSS